MVKTKDLCLAFVKYFINFENKRQFVLLPSPPMNVISYFTLYFQIILKCPSTVLIDVSNSINIIKLSVATRNYLKVLAFCKNEL